MTFSAFIITTLNLIARGFHLLFFLFIGNRFGVDATTDTVFLLQAPLLVIISVVAGVAESVIMPAMHRAFQMNCTKELLNAIKYRAVIFIVPVTFLVLIVASRIYENSSLGIIFILAPMPLLASLSSINTGVLNAEGKHRRAILGPIYGSMASIPFVFILPISAYSLASALVIFEVGRALGLWLHVVKYPTIRDYNTSAVHNLIGWANRGAKLQVIGSFLIALNPLVDIFFASKLEIGAITNVEYANRLWNVVPLFLSGHLTLAYAAMSREASTKNLAKSRIRLQALKLGAVASAISVVVILSSDFIINVLYGIGKMDELSRKTLSNLLSCYLLGAGPFLGGLVFVRALSSEGRINIITYIAGFSVITNVILNFILIYAFGLNGIWLATSFTYICNAILLGYMFGARG
jgi:peptidoglycan biosynthesis protein MviN/MurJ (putative lipid II flippase)